MTQHKLEALVGHLFITGGHTLQSNPPGTLVKLPPRRVHRSREDDTLFVLITIAGRKPLPTEFYDELAKLGANKYFQSRVGVTGALRDAMNAINARLYGSDFRAGTLLLVKRTTDVYVARAGTTLCAVRGRAGYETFPRDPELLNILPLGSRSEPTVEFSRFDLNPNDVFVLGDAGFAAITDNVLEACISRGNVEQVLDQLESVVTKEATASVIQFVPPEGVTVEDDYVEYGGADSYNSPLEDNVLAHPVQGNTVSARTSQTTTDVLVETAPDSRPILEQAQVAPEIEAESDIDLSDDIFEALAPLSAVPSLTSDGYLSYSEETPPIEDESALAELTDTNESATANDVPFNDEAEPIAETLAEVVAEPPLVEPTLPRLSERRKARRDAKTATQPNKKPKQAGRNVVAAGLRTTGRGINSLLTRLLPEPAEDTPQMSIMIPLNIVAVIAIFIPAIIAVAVIGFSVNENATTQFEKQRKEAIAAHEEAIAYSAISAADKKTARQLWEITRSQTAAALREKPNDDEMITIYREAQQQLDTYDRARRVDVTILRDFGENADLRGPIVAVSDIYTLDRNRSQVYQDTLSEDGTTILRSNSQAVIYRTQPIQAFVVSNLIDIEWTDGFGAVDTNALIALDENALLISYSPVYPPANALQLVKPPDWRRPVAIARWGNNLYVLDAGANQIWRYQPIDGYYNESPSEYFTDNRPDLSSAIDLTIDEQGAVYILFSDGHLNKYVGGEKEKFAYFEEPIDGIQGTRAIFVDNNPISYALYIAAQGNEALYQVSLGGRVNFGFRPSTSPLDAFRSITGVFVDTSRNTKHIYILSGSTMYYLNGD